jgi:hypothetical protein
LPIPAMANGYIPQHITINMRDILRAEKKYAFILFII